MDVVKTKHRNKYVTDVRILRESPLSLFALSRILPNCPGVDTVRLWASHGRQLEGKRKVVKLGTVAGTAGRMSSMAAYERFIMAINEG